jgi:hypothetical protein
MLSVLPKDIKEIAENCFFSIKNTYIGTYNFIVRDKKWAFAQIKTFSIISYCMILV